MTACCCECTSMVIFNHHKWTSHICETCRKTGFFLDDKNNRECSGPIKKITVNELAKNCGLAYLEAAMLKGNASEESKVIQCSCKRKRRLQLSVHRAVNISTASQKVRRLQILWRLHEFVFFQSVHILSRCISSHPLCPLLPSNH